MKTSFNWFNRIIFILLKWNSAAARSEWNEEIFLLFFGVFCVGPLPLWWLTRKYSKLSYFHHFNFMLTRIPAIITGRKFSSRTHSSVFAFVLYRHRAHTGHRRRRSTLLADLTPSWAINFTRPCERSASSTEWCRMAFLLRHQRARRRQQRSWWHRTSIMSRNTPFITTWHMRVVNSFRYSKYSAHPSLSDAHSSSECYFYGFNMILSKLAIYENESDDSEMFNIYSDTIYFAH